MATSVISVKLNKDTIDKIHVVTTGKDFKRDITVQIGKEFVVKPINPLKLKNRDRRVKVMKFLSEPQNMKVQVNYLDNNRTGKVDLVDLDTDQ